MFGWLVTCTAGEFVTGTTVIGCNVVETDGSIVDTSAGTSVGTSVGTIVTGSGVTGTEPLGARLGCETKLPPELKELYSSAGLGDWLVISGGGDGIGDPEHEWHRRVRLLNNIVGMQTVSLEGALDCDYLGSENVTNAEIVSKELIDVENDEGAAANWTWERERSEYEENSADVWWTCKIAYTQVKTNGVATILLFL